MEIEEEYSADVVVMFSFVLNCLARIVFDVFIASIMAALGMRKGKVGLSCLNDVLGGSLLITLD